jgi:hypothetical protein
MLDLFCWADEAKGVINLGSQLRTAIVIRLVDGNGERLLGRRSLGANPRSSIFYE